MVKHITEHMAGKGHEVYLVTYNRLRVGGIGSLPREEVINSLKVIRLKLVITWSHDSYSPELPYLDEDKIEDLLSNNEKSEYSIYQ
ncbi:MAG: hypothetical protein ACP5IE_04885 [Infirmifilum sp.]